MDVRVGPQRRFNAKELMFLNCGVGEVLRVPCTVRRSNLSILKDISPEYSLEGLMLRLKLQYFHHLMWRTDTVGTTLCWERLKARGEGDDRGWDGNNNPIYETAKETQMYRTVFWTLWESVRVGWFGRIALKHVSYHMWNRLPVQVQCMIQDARGWCTVMT